MFMNKQESDIMAYLYKKKFINQRILSEEIGYSLGIVNRSLKNLYKEDYLNSFSQLTEKAFSEISDKTPKRAIILAAGFGMRMVPINLENPKGLLEVNGEPLIERIIKQLHEVDVKNIYVVVGFMKERYEYLIDEYGVKLVFNRDYALKNNLHSLMLVKEYLENSYIIPCDIWCNKNPFNNFEMYSWYMVSDSADDESDVRVNRKMELVRVPDNVAGNSMIGISYLDTETAKKVSKRIDELAKNKINDDVFWEKALYHKDRMITYARVVPASQVFEINTYEQLRDLDSDSNQLNNEAIKIICGAFNIECTKICNISVLKKGMTNRSFSFEVNAKRYIMRVPGEGTDKLINRRHEYDVYQVIKDEHICDPVIYMNPDNGYKITEYIEDAHACDASYFGNVSDCMKKLKSFHDKKLVVNHTFEVFDELEKYESYWQGTPSIYRDYKETKKHIYELKEFVDGQPKEWGLSHIDSVPDNFLFSKDNLYLIDWEYAGMQDQHMDIAMFAIYSLYDRNDVETLIDLYFDCECDDMVRIKIYAYIAICGLLWSNWCEYKRNLGVEFGEYSLKQYRYAKEYYRIVKEELEERGMCLCTK